MSDTRPTPEQISEIRRLVHAVVESELGYREIGHTSPDIRSFERQIVDQVVNSYIHDMHDRENDFQHHFGGSNSNDMFNMNAIQMTIRQALGEANFRWGSPGIPIILSRQRPIPIKEFFRRVFRRWKTRLDYISLCLRCATGDKCIKFYEPLGKHGAIGFLYNCNATYRPNPQCNWIPSDEWKEYLSDNFNLVYIRGRFWKRGADKAIDRSSKVVQPDLKLKWGLKQHGIKLKKEAWILWEDRGLEL